MNCPICKKPCILAYEAIDLRYDCYCNSQLLNSQLRVNVPNFTARCPQTHKNSTPWQILFRQSNKLHMNYAYGTWSIWIPCNTLYADDIAYGHAWLSPETAYQLLKRYQNLKAFS